MANTSLSTKVDANSRPTPFYTPKNITAAGSFAVKTTGGFLHTITLNKPTATCVIEIADVGAATTVYGTITVPASPMPVTLTYDIELTNSIAVTMTTANSDITVSYL